MSDSPCTCIQHTRLTEENQLLRQKLAGAVPLVEHDWIIGGLQAFALAVVSIDRTGDLDAVIAATPDHVLRLIDPDMVQQ